jgi:energy-coupling factor transporter ATP-binding protein EcfA2
MTVTIGQRLTEARQDEIDVIRASLEKSGVVTVLGEAGVGKSTLLSRLVRAREYRQQPVAYVDLDGAASISHLGWLWFRALAQALTPWPILSQLVALPQDMWPGSARRAALALDSALGPDRSAIALADSPPVSHGKEQDLALLEEAIALTGKLTETTAQPLLLVIDHLEALLLTPRHPVELGRLLWSVRSVSQTTSHLRVVLVGRPGVERHVTGENAAFHQSGRWVNLVRPGPNVWTKALPAWSAPAVLELLAHTEWHVPTTLLLASELSDNPTDSMISEAFSRLAATQVEHAARCVEHARTLDRLGGPVLLAIARGRGPYTGTGYGHPRDAQRAVNRLRLAGLVDRSRGERWTITDPLVGHQLRAGISQSTWEKLSRLEEVAPVIGTAR